MIIPSHLDFFSDKKEGVVSVISKYLVNVKFIRVYKFFSSESNWTPKTQPFGQKAVAVWLSFWYSARPLADTGTNCHEARVALFWGKAKKKYVCSFVRPFVRPSVRHKIFFLLESPWNHPLTTGVDPRGYPRVPGPSGGARQCPRSGHFLVKNISVLQIWGDK